MTEITGPKHFDGVLPQPQATAGFYRDITVLAVPNPGDGRLPGPEPLARPVIIACKRR